MSLGFDAEQHVVNLNDTADLTAVLYDQNNVPVIADNLVSVVFTVQDPSGVKTTVLGLINDDGSGSGVYRGTSLIGHYTTVASFTDMDQKVKSVRADFDVIDPFTTDPNFSASYLVATQIWAKVEDTFDSEDGGPWLTEMTMNTFRKEKMESFIDIALFDINNLNPPTALALGSFVLTDPTSQEVSATADLPLLVQGGYIACLRHLMASYTEQPNPAGAASQIGWQDRRDYLTRWMQIYTIEFAIYDRMAKLYKRRYLGLGKVSSLISSKAGRLIPAPMRTRFVGRGYW